jgi:uncharacterized protein YjeT (DUF2065 family)
MKDFVTALALALVIEGALYALFPGPMRRTIVRVASMPSDALAHQRACRGVHRRRRGLAHPRLTLARLF